MIQITTLNEKPDYSFTMLLPNLEIYKFRFYYLPRQQYWMIDLSYKDITINGRRVVATNNLYADKRLLLPYGISVLSPSGLDPYGQDAFTQRGNKMYIAEYSEIYYE